MFFGNYFTPLPKIQLFQELFSLHGHNGNATTVIYGQAGIDDKEIVLHDSLASDGVILLYSYRKGGVFVTDALSRYSRIPVYPFRTYARVIRGVLYEKRYFNKMVSKRIPFGFVIKKRLSFFYLIF